MPRRFESIVLGLAVVGMAVAPAFAEPVWASKPLSHWLRLLEGSDRAATLDAARALTQIALAHGSDAIRPALARLIDLLKADTPELRLSATTALEQVGSTAVAAQPALLELFELDPDAEVRAHAGLALGRIQPTAAEVVDACGRVLARDSDPRVRQAAAAGLVQAGAAAHAAAPAVQAALADSDATVRVFAAGAAGQLGQAEVAVPVLLAALSHQEAAVRAEAAGLLAAVTIDASRVVAPLIAALGDRDAQVRLAAADALGHVGPAASSALQPLWRLIRDPDEHVREGALRAIRKIRG